MTEEQIEGDTEDELTKKLERTDTGYRFKVKSKRGTGTNDRDEVEAELRTEERPEDEQRDQVVDDVIQGMNYIRFNQPDEELED